MESPSAAGPDRQTGLQPADAAPAPAVAPAIPQKTRRVYRGTGVVWALVAALVAVVLLVILIAQNTDPVTIHFLWFTPEVSLVVLVLASVVLAVCVTEGVGLVWRHRRRQRLTQRDELRRMHEAEY